MFTIKKKRFTVLALLLALVLLITGCGPALDQAGNEDLKTSSKEEVQPREETQEEAEEDLGEEIDENGQYSSKDDLALYIHKYGRLPSNFIRKKEASQLGWNPKEGNLWQVTDGKSIGGDYFGNREGLLPKAQGRKYWECDVDYDGGFRGSKRIVYSNDGLIYYTEDHYKSFTLLYGEEE